MSMGQRKIFRSPTMNRPKDSILHFSAQSLSYRDLSTHSELKAMTGILLKKHAGYC